MRSNAVKYVGQEDHMMTDIDLTTDDVAAALRLNKATVQRLLKTGRLEGYQIGRAWRVPPAALEDFRAYGLRSGRSRSYLPASPHAFSPQPLSVTDNYGDWERLLLAEDHLAAAPAIPLEAMRRESMYEGQD